MTSETWEKQEAMDPELSIGHIIDLYGLSGRLGERQGERMAEMLCKGLLQVYYRQAG